MRTGERLFREACKSAESDLRRRKNEIAERLRVAKIRVPPELAKDVALIRRWRKVVNAAGQRISAAGYRFDDDLFTYGYRQFGQLQSAAHKPLDVALTAIPALRQKYGEQFFTADRSEHAAVLRRALAELATVVPRG